MQLDPKKHATPLAFFLATNRREVKWLTLFSGCYTAAVASMLVATFYVGRLVDQLQQGTGGIWHSIIFIIGGVIGYEVGFRAGHIIEVYADARIRASLKQWLFAHVSNLSYGYFADRFAGQLAHRITSTTDAIEQMVETVTNVFIEDGLLLLLSAVALAFIHPHLGIFVLGWGALFSLGTIPFARSMSNRATAFADQESKTTGIFVDFFTNIAAVKVYGKDHQSAYRQILAEKKAYIALNIQAVFAKAYVGWSIVILAIGFIVLTTSLYTSGLITVGGIVVVSGVVLRLVSLSWDIGQGSVTFVRQRGEAAQNLKDLIVAPAVADTATTPGNAHESVAVNYNDVTFAYGDKTPVLEHFSLAMPAGQKVGIVGLSGAGKTTFANLLLRFFDVQQGSVRINDVDVRELSQAYLRSHISYISQDTSLFHMTIRENIAYGMPEAVSEDIERAAKLAYADEFIATLPERYDSVVGERGIKLSGGQRQRIAIARAILADRPLFLLDEATSALDSDSEAKIQKGLEALMEGKTVIAIAHRLSTLSRMDRIIYLEDGKILEDGSHDELLAKNGKYATLWRMQAGGFLPS